MLTKREQRRIATERRRALPEAARDAKSRQISEHLIQFMQSPANAHVRYILSYRAMWDEANVDIFNRWAASQGMRVAFPIALPHGVMKAAVPKHEGAWRRGAFGIWEPVEEQSEMPERQDIDCVIVPCTAFDRQGGRCGHGAGYYDRYLAGMRDKVAVMAAFDIQELDRVTVKETDIPVRIIVTESGVKMCPEEPNDYIKEEDK